MASSKTLKIGRTLKFMQLGVIIVVIFMALPSYVLADDNFKDNPLSFAPPQLDSMQAGRWVNAAPWARVYLARLWGIDQKVAEKYGAEYKMPTCGLAFSNPNAVSSGFPANPGGDRWDVNFKYIEPYVPIPIKYPEPSKPNPTILQYNAPPGLDTIQSVRWGQAMPWVKVSLARIWGIPKEIAIKYGAE